MSTLGLTLAGGDRLAATAHQASADLADLDKVHDQAADTVLGYLHHPTGQPAGIAANLRRDPDPLGFVISAQGSSAPFLDRFLGDTLTAAEQDVVDLYATTLGHVIEQIEGN